MASAIWAVVSFLILVYFWWANQIIARGNEEERYDAGLAIIEFGRAFPDEAIRQIVVSADASMFFLRLWDGGIGCMRPNGRHYQCHIVQPGNINVQDTPDPRALQIDFPGTRMPGGVFAFKTQREAAEVSLWLLGVYVPVAYDAIGLSPA